MILFLKCCYQQILRPFVKNIPHNEYGESDYFEASKSTDNEFKLSKCKTFSTNQTLDPNEEFILVACAGSFKFGPWKSSRIVYRNAHAMVRSKENVKKKLKQPKDDKISVFIMAIDSVSRMNLIRGMPETYNHLESNGWFEMRGLNKIGDNTHPNLMAMLTGHHNGDSEKVCKWDTEGELDKCYFIWNDYADAGYVTAYAEDEAFLNTFSSFHVGFNKQPTDHYIRPFAIAIENKLEVKTFFERKTCVGYQHYADFIYQYGLDFANKYKEKPSFGLFWTNSFSHEELSMVSTMDTRVLYYLKQLETQKILDSSIVIFLSDHGMRFGPIRDLYTGWLEERLPFFYMWLPEKFQSKHPKIVKNLRINRDRLASPYDVHLTLKHILQLSGGNGNLNDSRTLSCPDCRSLFSELPFDRSCHDAGINKHWCTCVQRYDFDEKSKKVQKAVDFLIKQMNEELSTYPKCAKLTLNMIKHVRGSKNRSTIEYLISFNVKPSMASLEATVRCDKKCKIMERIGSISRTNRYGNQSSCINDEELRKICFCI